MDRLVSLFNFLINCYIISQCEYNLHMNYEMQMSKSVWNNDDFTPIGCSFSVCEPDWSHSSIVYFYLACKFCYSFHFQQLSMVSISISFHSPFFRQLRSHSPSSSRHWGHIFSFSLFSFLLALKYMFLVRKSIACTLLLFSNH